MHAEGNIEGMANIVNGGQCSCLAIEEVRIYKENSHYAADTAEPGTRCWSSGIGLVILGM
jgi:hypothetical protein